MVAVRILDVVRVVLVVVVRIVVIMGVVRIGLGLGCESCTSRGG